MSVNDDLPWIAPVLALIRQAVANNIPVLGHCLGGQLMSKALGGVVARSPVKEIGWGEVRVADNDTARALVWERSALKRSTGMEKRLPFRRVQPFCFPAPTAKIRHSRWKAPGLAMPCRND